MHSPRLVSVFSAILGVLSTMLVSSAASASPDLEARVSAQLGARAAAVSGPVISVTPSSRDFGRVNVGETSAAFDFTIENVGDATLTLSGVTHSAPGFSATLASLSIPVGGSTTLSAAYTPSGSGTQSDNVTISSDASNGNYVLLLRGTANLAPVFEPALAALYALAAFNSFTLVATASDAEGDYLTWSMSSIPSLPVGATFDNTSGTLDWTPLPGAGGDYAVTITVSDGFASTQGHTTLRVSDSNHPPTANAAGPYRGAVGLPLIMNGSASRDPDAGQILTYSWDFGDGVTGSGVTPSHAYAHARDYIVSLWVTDNGSPPLSANALTSAAIVDFVPVTIVQPLDQPPVIKAGKRFKFGVESYFRPLTEIDLKTMRLSTTYPNAGPVKEVVVTTPRKGIRIGDMNANLFYDLFLEANTEGLLSNVPNRTIVTIVFDARTTEFDLPFPVHGTVDLKVMKGGGRGAAPLELDATPNPFKPATTIRYTVQEAGPVSIRIFSVQGRLVRTLRNQEYTEPGIHETRWDGLSDQGRAVVSGVYLVRTTAGDEVSTLKLAVMK
ncbi:MAG TPA: PKD domain-containing protein [Candidatus Dormibacteraeota bacterium]|nr:PKD domain-containing protein [Candidatus Dormibacteraeota bacterium]